MNFRTRQPLWQSRGNENQRARTKDRGNTSRRDKREERRLEERRGTRGNRGTWAGVMMSQMG